MLPVVGQDEPTDRLWEADGAEVVRDEVPHAPIDQLCPHVGRDIRMLIKLRLSYVPRRRTSTRS